MRRNPERVAWTVLWAAFVGFCLLAAGIPLGIRAFLLNAREVQDTRLQVIAGTVLVSKPNGGEPLGVTEGADLAPQDTAITDATSWATLDFFDRSHITLYGNSQLRLERVQNPRFRVSDRPNQVSMSLTNGLMRVGVALPGERATQFQVTTPHTTLALEEGSYRIEVTNRGTQITVVRGRATLQGDGKPMVIPQGTRTVVDLGGEPTEPMPAARNLIENGNFQQPYQTHWLTSTVILNTTVQPPRMEVVEVGGRQAVRLVRREPDNGNHSEVSIQQKLDQDVRDFGRLQIALDVRVDFQSLSGGGLQSSEFPIIVRLDYKDLWGNDKFWTHGFYYQNRDGYDIALDALGQPSGQLIPRALWYPYESGNLLVLLGDNRPARLTRLTIYASGWNYDSLVSEIQLIVE